MVDLGEEPLPRLTGQQTLAVLLETPSFMPRPANLQIVGDLVDQLPPGPDREEYPQERGPKPVLGGIEAHPALNTTRQTPHSTTHWSACESPLKDHPEEPVARTKDSCTSSHYTARLCEYPINGSNLR